VGVPRHTDRDRFTNKKLFECDARGNLVKDRDGNLTKINDDNP